MRSDSSRSVTLPTISVTDSTQSLVTSQSFETSNNTVPNAADQMTLSTAVLEPEQSTASSIDGMSASHAYSSIYGYDVCSDVDETSPPSSLRASQTTDYDSDGYAIVTDEQHNHDDNVVDTLPHDITSTRRPSQRIVDPYHHSISTSDTDATTSSLASERDLLLYSSLSSSVMKLGCKKTRIEKIVNINFHLFVFLFFSDEPYDSPQPVVSNALRTLQSLYFLIVVLQIRSKNIFFFKFVCYNYLFQQKII